MGADGADGPRNKNVLGGQPTGCWAASRACCARVREVSQPRMWEHRKDSSPGGQGAGGHWQGLCGRKLQVC